ncbi:5-methyltetrahydrofolate--homocysteine methyltransferase [Dethiosulfatibacter aminovorans DSM 17477]|uniref:5-methyltetrahydrofolate--homocysteine methyltransferase n=1 Tax=Dethiosulfatibacter aminovorans DSM 17477 TaxID=1121476 RepID=A0A1M6IQ80_9FIRM|nr:corrinoid protein [Dethiosulfatibacter aminovorans]SHJ36592.1 5-methyltetrahydrofolate--homocysteine methyltransferase [Dethiosulfatibacter aminovorans DSM 17477]
MNNMYEQITESLIKGRYTEVAELTQKALDEGYEPKEIINEALLTGMNEVGELFSDGEMFVPEVLVAAKAMASGMDLLKPLLKEGDVTSAGKCIFCTVKGDLHDIGKKLVAMMLEGAGYEIVDLGVDVGPEAIIEAVKEHQPDIIGMSAMLTTTMMSMKETVEALKENGMYDKLQVMIGGAPVSTNYADQIGASFSADAAAAVDLANRLMA